MTIARLVDDGGIAWLELSGTLGITALRTLDSAIDQIIGEQSASDIRWLVIVGSDPDIELSGYDLENLEEVTEDEIAAWSHEAQRILARLEELPFPSVAAVEGMWTGSAAEVALSCTYRVMSDGPLARIGFSQISDGMIPAWGATVRLPRLIGLDSALKLLVSGRILTAVEALAIRLIDRVVPAAGFREAVRAVLEGDELAQRVRPQTPVQRGLLDRISSDRAANKALRELPAGVSELAARTIVRLVTSTRNESKEKALAHESAAAARMFVTPESRGRQYIDSLIDTALVSTGVPSRQIESAAVLGASDAGIDIANLILRAGVGVRLREARRDELYTGIASARRRIVWEQESGTLQPDRATSQVSRLVGVTGYGGFGTLDLVVVPAADEGLEQVASKVQEVEKHVQTDCVVALHSWAISPAAIRDKVSFPDRVVGLVPSFPSDRFPLVEVIGSGSTSSEAMSRTTSLIKTAGLIPVVSERSPTSGTRLLGVYFSEAARLLEEGATTTQVDTAALEFGYSVGPFHRMDAVGTRRSLAMLRLTQAVFGERMQPSRLMVHIGEKNQTFHRYRGGVPSGSNPDLPAGVSPGGDGVTLMIQRRLFLSLVREAVLCLEDGTATEPETLDIAAVIGVGFPRAKGGPMFQAEELGLSNVLADLERAAARLGNRFTPPALLRTIVATDSSVSLRRHSLDTAHATL